MSDLVERLRAEPDLLERCRLWLSQWEGMEPKRRTIAMGLVAQAADEIERLRAGLREIAEVKLPPHGMGGRDALNVATSIARRLLGEEPQS